MKRELFKLKQMYGKSDVNACIQVLIAFTLSVTSILMRLAGSFQSSF